MMEIIAGAEFYVTYPFVREKVQLISEDGYYDAVTYRPGISVEHGNGPHEDKPEIYADAEGKMILTVVDVFKPGKFPMRVFYTRKFIDPDGKEFGKNKLLIATLEKFKRHARSYGIAYSLE